MRLGTLVLFFVSTAGFAASWSGYLVDSRCWSNRETNVTLEAPNVNHDPGTAIRSCSPRAHTKRFAVVLNDQRRFKLDSAGNLRAYELMQHGKVSHVTVSGVLKKTTIHVSSIAPTTVKKGR